MNQAVYFILLKGIRDAVPENERDNFDLQFAIKEKSTTVALVLSIFFGTLGIDRFYLGNIFLGLLKLCTLGFFGIWTLIDWFLIMGAARDKNIAIAKSLQYIDGHQAHQKASSSTSTTSAKTIFLCVLIAFVLIIFISSFGKNQNNDSTQTSHFDITDKHSEENKISESQSAMLFCRDLVRSDLLYPEETNFDLKKTEVNPSTTPAGPWVVTLYLSTVNEFHMRVNVKFLCAIRKNTDNQWIFIQANPVENHYQNRGL